MDDEERPMGCVLEREIRHDEADAREQRIDVVLDFRHDPSGRRPAST